MNLINKLKASMVFSMDTTSLFKSIWIGPLLITWSHDHFEKWYDTIDFSWYGFDYFMPGEVEFEMENE